MRFSSHTPGCFKCRDRDRRKLPGASGDGSSTYSRSSPAVGFLFLFFGVSNSFCSIFLRLPTLRIDGNIRKTPLNQQTHLSALFARRLESYRNLA